MLRYLKNLMSSVMTLGSVSCSKPAVTPIDPAIKIVNPVKHIEPALSQYALVSHLKKLKENGPTAETMQAISQLLQTRTGHRNFFNPIQNGDDQGYDFGRDREDGKNNSCYEVQLLNASEEGKQEIEANENLTNSHEKNIYSYTYENYKSNSDAPVIAGTFYGIKDIANKTIELLGFLRIAVKPDRQEYIYLTFGEKNQQEFGNSIYRNNVVVDAHNVPQKGKFSINHHKGVIKTYDFAHLTDDDKVVLKALKIFGAIK